MDPFSADWQTNGLCVETMNWTFGKHLQNHRPIRFCHVGVQVSVDLVDQDNAARGNHRRRVSSESSAGTESHCKHSVKATLSSKRDKCRANRGLL